MCRVSYLRHDILTPRLSVTPHRTWPSDSSGGGCNEPSAYATWFQLLLCMTRQRGASKQQLNTVQRSFVFMVQITELLLPRSSTCNYLCLFYQYEDQFLKLEILY